MQINLLLKCKKCNRYNYRTSRNRDNAKLNIKKHCEFCFQHNYHEERIIK